jgi:ergothioneine biosynthesis protein EgtB
VHERLRRRLAGARAQTDALFALVRAESLYERPIPERHRLAFYLGHVEAFDWNLLGREGLGLRPFDPELDRLFAFGIDPLDPEGLPTDTASDWPEVAAIRRYGRRARAAVDQALEACAFGHRLSHPTPGDAGAVDLAIEHRLMHAETLAYLLHELPSRAKRPGPLPVPTSERPPLRLLQVAAGRARLGLEPDEGRFAWDNEYAAHDVEVKAFAIDSHKVTNGDFLRFVLAGGYTDSSLWSPEDWAWRKGASLEHPWFWALRDGQWRYRAMFGEVPLGDAWPVYVSHAEASAYAQWKRARLPTEEEYHRAAYGSADGSERSFPWGEALPGASRGVFGFGGWDPAPVGAHPAGDTPAGASGLVGNGWEWTSSPFRPFPGFEPLAAYAGYSAPFFDGRHYVLKGASPRTATSLIRRSFRNWFQPHYPYAYATFRCVRSPQ